MAVLGLHCYTDFSLVVSRLHSSYGAQASHGGGVSC